MKKIFTLLVSSLCMMSMAAETTVAVAPNGSTCTLTVGDATLNNVPVTTQGGVNIAAVKRGDVTVLVRYTDANTLVADGMLNNVPFHYATASAITFAGGFQIPNGNFEAWTASSGEPDHWHGFKSGKGSFASTATSFLVNVQLGSSTDVRPNSTGSKSVLITSGGLGSTVANGTVTNGQLNAGSMTADDVSNHSEMDRSSTATDNNGDKFYTALQAAPDGIATWLKFSQKTANSSYPYATMSAVVFDGSYYQDPEDKTYTNVAAKAQHKAVTTGGWRQVVIPFDYDSYSSNNAEAAAILVTVSTNATPGKGSKGDQVWIDDMELVYNAGVTSITATGLDGFAFDAATHDYTITYDGEPLTLTADNFAVVADGRAAMTVKAVEDLGDGNYSIVLGAVGADLLNASLYTITVTREVAIPTVWVMGNVNGNNWAANVGAEMAYNEADQTYTLDVTATGTAYFSFTKRLGEGAEDWDAIAPYRFGANTPGEGNNFVMRRTYLGQEIELAQDGWYNAFELPAGNYRLTIKHLDGDRCLIIDGEWPDAQLLVQGSFNDWSSQEGLLTMNRADDGTYTTAYNVPALTDGYSYFKLIKREAGEQDVTIGAVSNGDFLVTSEQLNTPLSLTADNGQAYKIPAGQFTLTANLEQMQLTIGGTLKVRGDVNGDGSVDVIDVNLLINAILNSDNSPIFDLDGNQAVDIVDVNGLINIILSN